MKGLIYVGDGRFLPGIPAMDLGPATITTLAKAMGEPVNVFRARLIASGLYAPVKR